MKKTTFVLATILLSGCIAQTAPRSRTQMFTPVVTDPAADTMLHALLELRLGMKGSQVREILRRHGFHLDGQSMLGGSTSLVGHGLTKEHWLQLIYDKTGLTRIRIVRWAEATVGAEPGLEITPPRTGRQVDGETPQHEAHMAEQSRQVHLSLKLRELSETDAHSIGMKWQNQLPGEVEQEKVPQETQPSRATGVANQSDDSDDR